MKSLWESREQNHAVDLVLQLALEWLAAWKHRLFSCAPAGLSIDSERDVIAA